MFVILGRIINVALSVSIILIPAYVVFDLTKFEIKEWLSERKSINE
jgi:hypothetical protein